jgi:hypothetical protein
MSKGLGQKITVKFTEELSPPGLIPNFENNIALGKPYTTNGTLDNRGYSATDGNTATENYIESSGTNIYIEVDLGEVIPVSAIKVWHYYSDSRIYNATKTEVSEDGINWVIVFDSSVEGTYQETSSGKTHTLTEITNARYVRDWLSGSNKNAGNHWVEIMAYGAVLGYESESWKVTGEEYQYVNGPLIPKEYKAISVEKHPDYSDDKHLLVTMHPQERFNNVDGPLTVQYDQSQGSLRGRGGPVEGFTEVFTPTDLEPKPNPGIEENLEISTEANVDFIKVTYRQAYAEEQITVSASATVDFIYVGVINP